MLSSRFAGIPLSSSTIDGRALPRLLIRGEPTPGAVAGSGGRLHFGMVAGFKSERRPASNRNRWPDCIGIRSLSYAVQALWRAVPSLRPERAFLSRVPLGPCPWLHQLRRRLPDFVRRLHRYYGRARLLTPVHHALRLSSLPHADQTADGLWSGVRSPPFRRDPF